jgi:threonyl-tRNA synthetase
MYGPKLDFMAKDSMGREHQVATIQLDMNLPERFDLSCINEKGEKERIVMIHCAVMGSFERFAAVLLEHIGGMFPLWLAPVQAIVIPVSESHTEYALEVQQMLKQHGVRAELSGATDSLGKRIRAAKLERVPYLLVVGDKEIESQSVSVRGRGDEDLGTQPLGDFAQKLKLEISEKNHKY